MLFRSDWATSTPNDFLFVSVVTILEIEIGILQKERKDPTQGQHLRHWFEQQVLPAFKDRVLPIDTDVARCCAKLHVPNRMSERDALIAATAISNNMHVVTRNTDDFESSNAPILNPWGKTHTIR